jgi:murein DD-endopeptidase MepM/ murein hydrolase activator NlpD
MKPSADRWTVVLFRGTTGNPLGTTGNPLRISVRKTTVKRVLLAVVLLAVVQVGVLVQYVVQTTRVTNQGAELEGLKAELSQSKEQAVGFSEAIDNIQQRVLTIQTLNEKLQVMFGLEPEKTEATDAEGQGGEEVSYDAALDGATGMRDVDGKNPGNPGARMAVDIKGRLSWLDRQTVREHHMLTRLEKAAGERVGLWAATPSIWPVKGPVSSRFGPRISPFTGKRAFHAGLDISGPRGKTVRAPAKGKVVAAAYDTKMGNFIRINHRHGIETTYGHLSKILVRDGQEIKRGDVLGLIGSTGRYSTGPHLHYQIAVHDKVVDPLQYILD